MKNILFLLPVLLFVSCSKDDPEPATTIDSATVELKYDKEHQYVLMKGTEKVDASTYTWKSSDTLVGKVDKTGKFIARKIGETTVTGTLAGKNVESKVTVTPYITSFKEPFQEFGATTAVVKTKETRKLLAETADYLAYEGESAKITSVQYELVTGKMTYAVIFFQTTQAIANEVITFYLERYPRNGETEEGAVFFNDGKDKAVELGIHPDYGLFAFYSPFDSKGLRSAVKSAGSGEIVKDAYQNLKRK